MVAVPTFLNLQFILLSGQASLLERSVDYNLWEDEELARHYLKTGDDDLFAVLVHRYKQEVFRLAVSILGPSFSEEAEEVVQETFLTVHRKLKRFRFDSKFRTWLYRIAFNRSIDWRRKPRLRLHHSDEAQLAHQVALTRNPLGQATDRERGERVLASVEGLPEPCRSVVYLYYWLDQSVAEISDYLDLNPSTVKSHLFRARKMLGSSLRGRV
jgi:RNA polymerase sigma-70 factor (ECF subfamily)